MKIRGLDFVFAGAALMAFLAFALAVYQLGRNAIPPMW